MTREPQGLTSRVVFFCLIVQFLVCPVPNTVGFISRNLYHSWFVSMTNIMIRNSVVIIIQV